MRYILAFLIGFAIVAVAMKVHAADLALPKQKPELCMQSGREPSPGQTLHADKTCPSGMRWVFQK
jgi:hypothetical protein